METKTISIGFFRKMEIEPRYNRFLASTFGFVVRQVCGALIPTITLATTDTLWASFCVLNSGV